jgi:ABC-type transporter Mla subunit MlaD
MPKKKSASRADAVREAAEQAFRAQIPRERISELLDELGSTAGRLRGAVDELRPASEAELKSLRAEVRALTARVEALESTPKPKPAAPRRKPSAAAKPAAAGKPSGPKARKPRPAPPAEGTTP